MAMGLAPLASPTARTAFGLADLRSERAVADGASGRDPAERRPHRALKGGAVRRRREIVNGLDRAVEIRKQGTRGFRRAGSVAQLDRVRTIVAAQQIQHARLMVVPIHRAQPLLIVADDAHAAGGRADAQKKFAS